MAVILLTSATGSPGVTTAGLGMALAWPRDVILIDADRNAGQAVLAGYLAGWDSAGRAIHQLIQPYRQGMSLRTALQANLMPLRSVPISTDQADPADGKANYRATASFLPGFSNPAAAGVFEPVWPTLGAELAALGEEGVDVLVDCGRVGTGLPPGLLDAANLLLLVGRSSLRSLAGLKVPARALSEAPMPAEVGLLLVGPDRPYSEREIAGQFSLPIVATVPWSPDEAAMLSDGITPVRRRREDVLAKEFVSIAQTVQERAARRGGLLQGVSA